MWEFRDNKLYAHPPLVDEDDPDSMDYVCERVEVIEKRVNLVTGEEFIKIAIQTRCGEKFVEGKRDILTRRSILSKLIDHGLSYLDNENNIQLLLDVLWATEALLDVKYFHEVTGFIEIRGSRCFLWDKAYGPSLTEAERTSEYNGSPLLKPRGSPKIWRKLLIKYAATRPSLAVVYGMGVSTFVAHILKEEGFFEEVLLWALIGDSSIGKTTLLSWQCSMLAHKRFLIQSFNATSNGFAAMLAERPGVGLYADEASHLSSSFDLDSMVYDLPRGRTKRRCKVDGTLSAPIDYGGAIIMSSEVSILSRCKKDLPGQKVRLIELNDVFFSKGEEAEEVRDIIAYHYGWGTEPLMTLLLSDGFTKKLVKRYQFFYKQLLAATTQRSGMDRRLLQRFAILLVSIWIAEKAFKVGLHLDNCKDYLVAFYGRLSEENAAEPAEDKLLSDIAGEIARYNGRFPEEIDVRKNRKAYTSQGIDGLKGHFGNTRCVWITEDTFKQMFKKHCSEDLISMCKKMHTSGYMAKFYGNRFYKEKSIVVGRAKCYCILFPEDNSITDILSDLNPADSTALGLAKSAHSDPHGLFVDKENVNVMIIKKDDNKLMTVRFEKLGAQLLRMIINKDLYDKLTLSTNERIYILPVPSKGILMVSKKELIKDCFFTRVHLIQDGSARSDVRPLTDIFDSFNLKLNLYEKITFTDISIDLVDEVPVAVVNMINNECISIVPIGGSGSVDNNIKLESNKKLFTPKSQEKIKDLLSEDPEDDE